MGTIGRGDAPASILATTIAEISKKIEDKNILRNRKTLAMLKSERRMTFNHSGDEYRWVVQFKRKTPYYIGAALQRSFQPINRYKNAVLPWRGMESNETIDKFNSLKNAGPQAIVKIWDEALPQLNKEMTEQLADDLYIDGNAAGNTSKMHGLESCLSNSGAASGGYIGVNNDTYASLSTTLAAYGGSWTGNWPSGTGDAEYQFFTPLIVDYTDLLWQGSGTTRTWAQTCFEVLGYAITKQDMRRFKLDVFMLENELFRQLKDNVRDKERINITQAPANSRLIKLGFGDTIQFDGVDVTSEYGIAAGVGYGISLESLELMSMQKQLFMPSKEFFDEDSASKRIVLDWYGNLKINPPGIVKLLSIT